MSLPENQPPITKRAAQTGPTDGPSTPTYKNPRLVVILHAWNQPPKVLEDLHRLIQENMPHTDVDIPSLPLKLFSCKSLDDLSNEIAQRLDDHWEKRCEHDPKGYEEIFLVGHSAGATLARTVYLCGLGTDFSADDMDAGRPRPWANNVRRLILFAAFNRGWEVSYLAQGFRAIWFAFGRRVTRLLRPLTGAHLGLQLYRGSRFITEMRLRWQRFEQRRRVSGGPWPFVIQLLGSSDELIAPEDSADMATGRSFVYLDLPFTDHYNMVRLYEHSGNAADDPSILAKRREVFRRALCEDEEVLRRSSELEVPAEPDRKIEDVVFVVHGIRDGGFWAQHIARTVLDRAEKAGRREKVKTITPSYGFFGMGPFLFQQNRHVKVAWFMEHYLLACAQYPEAMISYIGHSNGTHLPAYALKLYPSCRFKRLGFAGSVIRSDFPWDDFLGQGGAERDPKARVEQVCNFVADGDLVVAGFPSLFEYVPGAELGGAGHRGFRCTGAGRVTNFRFAPGGHSAALAEIFWDSLGDFIITGTLPTGSSVSTQRPTARVVGRLPLLAWLGAILLALLLLTAFVGVAYLVGKWLNPTYLPYWIGGSVVAWFWALLTILRRI